MIGFNLVVVVFHLVREKLRACRGVLSHIWGRRNSGDISANEMRLCMILLRKVI